MSTRRLENRSQRCEGTLPRREFLKLGYSTLGGLSLLDLSQYSCLAGAPQGIADGKSIIVLWLWGGPSHLETFDLKPDAPSDYRGEFRPIRTSVPGLEISEHLPQLAKLGDKFAILRSLHHDSPGHVNSTHTMLTGYPGETVESPPYQPSYPDIWSVASHVRGPRIPGAPAHIAMPRLRYGGSAHLGGGLDPFVVTVDPNKKEFRVPNLAIADTAQKRIAARRGLVQKFDAVRSHLDHTGVMDSLDDFNRQAATLLTSGRVQRAFQLDEEDNRVRERYGRHAIGQRCLLARRLIEAGVRMVSIDFPCVPGQKAFSWDDHASVWNIFEQMKIRLPVLDQVTSALIKDIYQRGLDQETLIVVMGEMSHTPRLSNFKGQPGREHWGQTMSVLLSGGGMRMGQAIGATSAKGDEPQERPMTPNDLLATLYDYLGVPTDLTFPDRFGRPTPILPRGTPIAELL